ncbi:hypothetical protein [Rhodococcus wratislaviensis]|uniref:Pyruvate dehydrogenase E1 component middle domain-containing protein n=1 Tax=Rhodococcus wratislaviensis NBRC 100605 TaxID=1219028 RepID=X0PWG0_RHOWR|nr:hypothetical protein [Rhodococcus wratislaviensis]GAF47628.1 hypothetical protein RW1_043_00630 [Rhodococcus wratislaviensis NBRC 100605]
MAPVRVIKELLRDKEIGKSIVPIAPDEARTFGTNSWFPSLTIYNRNGQLDTSVDAELMRAKEVVVRPDPARGHQRGRLDGSFTPVGTSYATHGEPMNPLYRFYSMFEFQRTGDGLWAAVRLGAASDRTTLTGEGLQHADGHSLQLASTNPAVIAYDPAFTYEIAHPPRRYPADVRRHRGPDRVRRGERLLPRDDLQRAVPAARRTGGPRRRAAGLGSKAQITVSGVAMPDGPTPDPPRRPTRRTENRAVR